MFLSLFAVEELYGTRYQSGSFYLINVKSGFHCLRTFFFFFFLYRPNTLYATDELMSVSSQHWLTYIVLISHDEV